jgi:hypothetical protein
LASCECIHQVLALTEEESSIVSKGIDDSTEPLKGIVARWKAALNAEGRVPW